MTTDANPSVDELLAAYADDPASLSVAERAAVEARLETDPAAAREVEELRALLGDVRANGDVADRGPDWAVLEANIRAAVTPSPRRWRWAAGAGVALAAAAGLALWWQARETDGGTFSLASLVRPVPAEVPDPRTVHPERSASAEDEVALEELDEVALELDDGEDHDGVGELDLGDVDHEALIGHAVEQVPVADVEIEDGLFPGLDTAWLDDLSEDEVAQALRWLDQQGAG